MNADTGDALGQCIGKRLPEEPHRERLALRADDDLRRVLAARKLEDFFDEIVADDAAGLRTELFGKTEGLVEPFRRLAVAAFAVGPLDEDDDPGCVQPGSQAACGAHHLFRQRIGADADQQALAAGPGPFDGVLLEIIDHLVVDPVGGAPERQLAQRRQIAEAEETLGGALGAVGQVNLAFIQPFDEFGRRQIDQQHVVGTAENRVGHTLAHRNTGDLGDDIGQAFQMLDVQRRPDVDAGGNQLLDILIALRMAARLGIAVRQFVDDDDLRAACKCCIQIEF